MSAKKSIENEIREAIVFLRTKNHTIPSETIEFMKVAALEKLMEVNGAKTFAFDCWNRKGTLWTKYIQATCVEDAKMIFEDKYPDLAYDEPYT